MSDSAATTLTIRLFGDLVVLERGEPIERLHVRSADRLLAFLLLNGPSAASSTSISDALWPDARGSSNLHQAVAQLRCSLGAEAWRVKTMRGFVSFDTVGVALDVAEFSSVVCGSDPAAIERAARIGASSLLNGWDDLWIHPFRESARDRLVQALKRAADVATASCDTGTAIRVLRQYVRRKLTDEPAWLDLMRLYVVSGDRLAAVDLYTRYSERLRKATGLAPSVQMTTMYEEMLQMQAAPIGTEPRAAMHEPVGGPVPVGSACYVERPVDTALRSALDHGEGTIVLRGPRQTGKSSLLARGLQYVRQTGARVVVTDFSTLTDADAISLDALCRWLALSTALQVGADDYTEDDWRPFLAPVANLERYVLRRLLSDSSVHCIWAMDEVDRLFGLPFAQGFFSILRSWHGRRSFSLTDPWRRLSLIVVCATEAHLYIPDLNRSPFNVGERVDVGDFSPEQVSDLNRRCGSAIGEDELSLLRDKVGGHPYLVRRALHELSASGTDLDGLFRDALADGGPFADHLRRLRRYLEGDPELLEGVHRVLYGQACSEECFFRLRSAGLLVGPSPDDAHLRCGLYADYFARHLR